MAAELTLERWDRLSTAERKAQARRLARELPGGFGFRSIRTYRLGDQEHHMAEFVGDGSTFVLIPGGAVEIGYDADRPWEPTPEELESWRDTSEEYEIDLTIHEQIAAATRRPKRVELRSFLMETRAYDLGWSVLSADDPEVQLVVRERLAMDSTAPVQVDSSHGDVRIRVNRGADGVITAKRAEKATHAELTSRLAKSGLRFPTSDEWEYACGAGASTLFRWGDHAPCDRYPTDLGPAEARWRRQWVLSAGKLEYPPEGFAPDWDLHTRPNGFGIFIASNPYECELVAEPEIFRGGDGGGRICGGTGFFLGWLTLATAYFEETNFEEGTDELLSLGCAVGRRVMPLS
jgi:hypothetical protein